MVRILAALLLAAGLAGALHPAQAQTPTQNTEAGSGFKTMSAEEDARLRAILAQPVPTGVLNTTLAEHFREKRNAADRLADPAVRLALLRQWIQAMPQETTPKDVLAVLLDSLGEFDEALRIRQDLLDSTKAEITKEWYRSQLAYLHFDADHFELAQSTNDQVRAALLVLRQRYTKPGDQQFMLRIEGQTLEIDSKLHRRFGRWQASVQSAAQGVTVARDSLKLLRSLPNNNDANWQARVRVTVQDLANRIGLWVGALRAANLFAEQQMAVKDFVRLSQEEELPPSYLARIYSAAGLLRLDQREFVDSEAYYRKADKVYESLGYAPTHGARLGTLPDTIGALEGQHRWADALKELERLDRLAGDDEALKKRTRYPFDRGYAYLGSNSRVAEAAALFESFAASQGKRFPASHFYVAQPRGLQGVALWRMGDAQSRAQALPLLRSAVHDYMLVDNVDYETLGVRKDIRELIFSTYLEAVFLTPNEKSVDAMAAADWVRGGMVQEALADAAVRSAASEPALADLVRGDQDARNEVEALRRFLAGSEGGTQTPLPEIAAKMRARIEQLETARRGLLSAIKARFPDYDRLVHPVPPTVADVSAALATDEALIMLLPTQDAVYVWAVTRDGNNTAARVEMPRARLTQLVQAIRKTLDFAAMGSNVPAFNASAASTLYQQLLGPVQASMEGKSHLIVAAGGVLGQIPFGVLLTRPTTVSRVDAPWLIRQAAITHVPSLSAWLAVKQFAKARSAPEALVAWGDPRFSGGVADAGTGAVATRHVGLTRAATSVDLEKEDPHSALRYGDIPALPETRDELLSIAAALHADVDRDLHLGPQATKASVLASSKSGELQRKKVVAFATHGLMAGDLPQLTQPALALASTGREAQEPLGALLTLDEVLNLKLNADWVILSACNTAAADGRADEALGGLARGFFYAGSRSLLVTHWAVESGSAMQLTTRTMAQYTAHPGERKAESLRQAMLSVMQEPAYAHPAYWAPYALVGDGGR